MILNHGHSMKPISLSHAVPGASYRVDGVSGPDAQRLRLNEMGIVPGTPVSVLSCSREGMTVVKVGGSRLALSRDLATHVLVHKAAPNWFLSHSSCSKTFLRAFRLAASFPSPAAAPPRIRYPPNFHPAP